MISGVNRLTMSINALYSEHVIILSYQNFVSSIFAMVTMEGISVFQRICFCAFKWESYLAGVTISGGSV